VTRLLQRRWIRNNGYPRRMGDGGLLGLMHAHKDGSPVLIGDSSWRTVNGIYMNTPWGHGWILFRRHS